MLKLTSNSNLKDCKRLLHYLKNGKKTAERIKEIVSLQIEDIKKSEESELLYDLKDFLKETNAFIKKRNKEIMRERREQEKHRYFLNNHF